MRPAQTLLSATFDAAGNLTRATGVLAAGLCSETTADRAPSCLADVLGHCVENPQFGAALAQGTLEALVDSLTRPEPAQAVLTDRAGGTLIVTQIPAETGVRNLLITRSWPFLHGGEGSVINQDVLQEIIDLLPATVSIKDPQQIYRFVNRTWLAYAGLSREQVLGKRHVELALTTVDSTSRPDHSDDIGHRDSQVLATGTPVLNREEPFVDAYGEERTLMSNKVPLLAPDGRARGVLSVTFDITERKRVESELIIAKHEAESANRIKSQFLATISHEIRTPLNGVLGMAQLLMNTDLTAQQREMVEWVQRSGDALLAIINEILDFSKLDSGQLELERRDFDLRDCVESVVSSFADQAFRKGLMVYCSLPADLPAAVCGDPTRFRQCLLNLIGNAVKFTEQGHIAVRVCRLPAQPRLVRIRVDVTDTGIGIPPETRQHIFDAFSQGDASTTRRYGGTGLGLAVASHLVRLMRGTLHVESEPGMGSRFWIDVPFERTRVPTAPAGAHLAGWRFTWALVATPDALLADSAGGTLPALGLPVRTATQIDDVLTALSRHGPADTAWLLVLDGGWHDPVRGSVLTVLADATVPEVAVLVVQRPRDYPDSPFDPDKPVILFTPPFTKPRLWEAVQALDAKLRRTGTAAAPATLETQPNPGTNAGATIKHRILLAEDNDVNQMVARRMLERLGCCVTLATNGYEAIEAFTRKRFDLLLLDVQMPHLDGVEATRHIRTLERARGDQRRPIVALTASTLDSDHERAQAAGMDGVIAKPFTEDQLSAALAKWCAG